MERRAEIRFKTDQPFKLTVLGETLESFPCRIINLSGKGLRLIIDSPLSPGTTVKLEGNDTLMLGEVVYCDPDGVAFAAGIELEQALYRVSQISKLANTLLQRKPASREA